MTAPLPSTASTLRATLEAAGTTPDAICPEDLADTYAMLNADSPPAQIDRPAEMMAPLATKDPGTDPLGVIVETRPHPLLETVTRQVLDQGITVQIFHGTENADFVADHFAGDIAAGRVHLTPMTYDTLGRDDYNGLFLCRPFWEALVSRGKILIFQTDALLCPGSPFSLDDFLAFDYIGSAWGRHRRRGIVVDGGNGGLSLRDWQLSTECLDRFPPEVWWAGGEDSYFGFHIDLIGGRVARPDEAARFGTQFWFLEDSFGAHKPNQLDILGQALFLAWYPDGRALFPDDTGPQSYRLARLLSALGLAQPATRLYRAYKSSRQASTSEQD
jgi:hypothetical protein